MSTKKLNTRQTLALRYRPKRLSRMVGQEAAIEIVNGMLAKETAPNAFMLTGPSGTGKTTMSRLITKHFNCDDLSACGKCESCTLMEKEAHPDYIEVNGAESGGIDKIRELIEVAKYRPAYSLRVIHIDEVHRATNPAINSLLKPLEEPPPCTLWVLSTTDPDKIPNAEAVMGRCIQLEMQLISAKQLAPFVYRVARKERMSWMDKKAASRIASAAEGHARNALQITESVNARADSGADVSRLISKASFAVGGDESRLALRALIGCYSKKPESVADSILSTKNHHQFVNRLAAMNQYLLMARLVGRHPGLWSDHYGKALVKAVDDRAPKTSVGVMVGLQGVLEDCRSDTSIMALYDAKRLLSARLLPHSIA